MSISYTVYFSSSEPIAELISNLKRHFSFIVDPNSDHPCELIGDDFALYFGKCGDASERFILEDYGLHVHQYILFECFDSYSGRKLLAEVVNYLSTHYAGDLMFHFGCDYVLLVRRHSEVVIDANSVFWDEHTRPAIKVPFTETNVGDDRTRRII